MMATTQFYQNQKYRLYPTVPAVMIGLKVKVFYLNKSKTKTVVILFLWCYHIIRLYPPPHPRPRVIRNLSVDEGRHEDWVLASP